jgi:hypothetical protein
VHVATFNSNRPLFRYPLAVESAGFQQLTRLSFKLSCCGKFCDQVLRARALQFVANLFEDLPARHASLNGIQKRFKIEASKEVLVFLLMPYPIIQSGVLGE